MILADNHVNISNCWPFYIIELPLASIRSNVVTSDGGKCVIPRSCATSRFTPALTACKFLWPLRAAAANGATTLHCGANWFLWFTFSLPLYIYLNSLPHTPWNEWNLLLSSRLYAVVHFSWEVSPTLTVGGISILDPKLLLPMGCVKLGEKIAFPCLLWWTNRKLITQFHATHGK